MSGIGKSIEMERLAVAGQHRVSFGGDEILWNQTEVMLVQHCDVLNAADYSLLNSSFYVNVNFTAIFKNKTNEQNPKNSLSVLGPGPPCPRGVENPRCQDLVGPPWGPSRLSASSLLLSAQG